MEKIKSFTDLNAWKEGHKLVLSIYKITEDFPKSEVFGLTNQMRRCAVSITSNIAEGFNRQSKKEKVQLYSIAQGSISELQNQIVIARDIRYVSNAQFKDLADITITVHKLLTGLIKSTKNMLHTS